MLIGMASLTHRERIVQALRLSSRPLDDDQLSERTGIRPRQAVNQSCRALERDGVLRRYEGLDGKIVNRLMTAPPDPPATAEPTADSGDAGSEQPILSRTGGHAVPPGSSREQRDAERVMLDLLGAELGHGLEPATLTVPSGARVEVDGADAERSVLVECWAHQGNPKAAQRHKVLADALKLTWIGSTIYPRPRLILCMSDPAAAAPFLPEARSWAAQALKDLGVTISVVELPDHVRQLVLAAQERQYR
jgi:hypothetical protein